VALRARVLGEALRLLAPDGQAPAPIHLEGTVYVFDNADVSGQLPAAQDIDGVVTTVEFVAG
jgi:hypothetical protein